MRAQRSEKEATLGLAEASLARQQITFSQKASSRADYETADATVKQTRAQIAALDAQITEAIVSVENARVNLDYTRITAPIDGTVLAVVTQAGQTVNAVQSAPTIAIIGQIETMTIRAEISEVDVIKVKPGQEVYFTILGDPVQRYTATLDSIGRRRSPSRTTAVSAAHHRAPRHPQVRRRQPPPRLRRFITTAYSPRRTPMDGYAPT
jgi:macrolide-specific efflux system membrane fusion protein